MSCCTVQDNKLKGWEAKAERFQRTGLLISVVVRQAREPMTGCLFYGCVDRSGAAAAFLCLLPPTLVPNIWHHMTSA
jgi:hypothetical protein